MENVSWGVPSLQKKKVEKFSTPAVTMHDLTKKGSGRKFTFNKAAIEALGLKGGESYITFGFADGKTFIQATDAEVNPSSLKLTKQNSVSNKRIYEYITKNNSLSSEIENYLHLGTVEGQTYMEVSSIEADAIVLSAPTIENDNSTVEDAHEDIPEVLTPVEDTNEEEGRKAEDTVGGNPEW
jgi:hypothetical protein